MGLIKADNAPSRMQPFSMADIENQAAELIARAKQKADRLLAEAQVQAKKIATESRSAGLRAGWREGWKKGHEEGAKAGRELALMEHKAELASNVQALTA